MSKSFFFSCNGLDFASKITRIWSKRTHDNCPHLTLGRSCPCRCTEGARWHWSRLTETTASLKPDCHRHNHPVVAGKCSSFIFTRQPIWPCGKTVRRMLVRLCFGSPLKLQGYRLATVPHSQWNSTLLTVTVAETVQFPPTHQLGSRSSPSAFWR